MVSGSTPTPRYPPMPGYGAGTSVNRGHGPTQALRPPDRGTEPGPSGIWLSIGLSVVVNLVTLVGVLGFGWPPGNVFLLFWCENAILGAVTLVKVATAQAPARNGVRINGGRPQHSAGLLAAFFVFHYGLFCVVHLVFTLIVALQIGIYLGWWYLGLPVVLIGIRYTVELVTTWFGSPGLRRSTAPDRAMMQPYPRIIVLHLAVLVAFGLVVTGSSGGSFGGIDLTAIADQLRPVLDWLPPAWRNPGVLVVVVLLLLKTAADVITTRRALRHP